MLSCYPSPYTQRVARILSRTRTTTNTNTPSLHQIRDWFLSASCHPSHDKGLAASSAAALPPCCLHEGLVTVDCASRSVNKPWGQGLRRMFSRVEHRGGTKSLGLFYPTCESPSWNLRASNVLVVFWLCGPSGQGEVCCRAPCISILPLRSGR
jgi:hypothetical protein